MPNTASAKKSVRQDKDRTLLNKNRRSHMRAWVRKVKEAVEAGDQTAAQVALKQAYSFIDRAARQNIIHDNTAANKKRKLTRLVNGIA